MNIEDYKVSIMKKVKKKIINTTILSSLSSIDEDNVGAIKNPNKDIILMQFNEKNKVAAIAEFNEDIHKFEQVAIRHSKDNIILKQLSVTDEGRLYYFTNSSNRTLYIYGNNFSTVAGAGSENLSTYNTVEVLSKYPYVYAAILPYSRSYFLLSAGCTIQRTVNIDDIDRSKYEFMASPSTYYFNNKVMNMVVAESFLLCLPPNTLGKNKGLITHWINGEHEIVQVNGYPGYFEINELLTLEDKNTLRLNLKNKAYWFKRGGDKRTIWETKQDDRTEGMNVLISGTVSDDGLDILYTISDETYNYLVSNNIFKAIE